jgi:hypothetical protein
LGVRLLGDLRTVFANEDAMHTETILERLADGEESGLEADSPWGDLRGKPINSRQLAEMLRPYGVSSLKVKINGRALQGYRRADLHDAWARYLPSGSATAELPEPPEPDSSMERVFGSIGSVGSAPAGYEGSVSGLHDAVSVGGDTDALE